MIELKLSTGPSLKRREWDYDEAKARGKWKTHDVTDRAIEYLFREVEIAKNVTLSDICSLISDNPLFEAVLRQDFVKEICAEAKKGAVTPKGEAWEQLEYLELYQVWSLNSATNTYEGVGRFNLHGIGVVLKEDIVEHGSVMHKKGTRIQWSVSMTPVREMLHLPVRINNDVTLCEDDLDSSKYSQAIQKGKHRHITLGAFIHATLWELSFYGTPEKTEEFHDKLMEQVAEVKAGTIETTPFEDIFETLGFQSKKSVYDEFFLAWNHLSNQEMYSALKSVEDTRPIQEGLLEAAGPDLLVKPDYAQLPARAFRKLLREAQHKKK